MSSPRYRWAATGDVNAFFGLMLDNVMNLVILAGILVFVVNLLSVAAGRARSAPASDPWELAPAEAVS